MTAAPEAFACAAEALVGVPFRLHGRTPASGLDCVGLVASALAACGLRVPAPHGYALRNASIERHLRFVKDAGFDRAKGTVARGDLLLVPPGPAQHHLLIACGAGQFVHAHAGLRRVVRDDGLPDAPLLHHWRLPPQVRNFAWQP